MTSGFSGQRPLVKRFGKVILISLVLLFVCLPIYWLAITAFKSYQEANIYPPTFFPNEPTLENFQLVLGAKNGLGAIWDSIVIAIGSLIACLVLGVPAAYGLSRYRLLGGSLAFSILSFRFMPPIVFSFAIFLIAASGGVLDTYRLMIVMNTLVNLPFIVWLMKGFFDEVPIEIEEAAMADGAGPTKIFWRITLPLVVPGLVSCGLFAFIFAWNELLFAVVLTDRDVTQFSKLIPGLTAGHTEPHWGGVAALSTIVIVPTFLIAWFLQRFVVRGLTYGAVK